MAVSSLKNKTKLSTLTSPFDIDLGGMIPLSTVTVGVGGAANIEFTSIPGYYEHLQIRGIIRTNGGGNLSVRVNSDSGNNYSYHSLVGNGSSASANNGSTQSDIVLARAEGISSTANTFNAFIVDILDYANTNKFKTIRSLSGVDKNGSGDINFESGLWQSTSAITSISFTRSTIQQYSSFALYGIKRAGA